MKTDFDRQTKLYSPLPAYAINPKIAIYCSKSQIERRNDPEIYFELPWKLGDIEGSVWRNIHTFHLLYLRNWNDIELSLDHGQYLMFNFSLFCDRGIDEVRIEVDHCVRIDHLPIQAQYDWHLEAVEDYQRKLDEKLEEAKSVNSQSGSCWKTNKRLRNEEAERLRKQLSGFIDAAAHFEVEHEIVGVRSLSNLGKAGQLSLF